MKKALLILTFVLISITGIAEAVRYGCTFVNDNIVSDRSEKTYDDALIEVEVSFTQYMMRMVVLPDKDAYLSSSLVDTVFIKGSDYRIGEDVRTDNFEEKNVMYIYQITPDQYLESYIVFSQFTDLKHKDINQIIIRKFDAKGKRLWMASINADKAQSKEFFKLLDKARKKLKFEKIESVYEQPGADGKKVRTVFENQKVRKYVPGGTGTPYNTQWK